MGNFHKSLSLFLSLSRSLVDVDRLDHCCFRLTADALKTPQSARSLDSAICGWAHYTGTKIGTKMSAKNKVIQHHRDIMQIGKAMCVCVVEPIWIKLIHRYHEAFL